MRSSRIVAIGWITVVALVYVFAARAGLALDAVSGFASLVWPASGIALAAIVLGGNRFWPAIAIGALVANYGAGAPALTAIGIAAGNTSAALVGAGLLRVTGFDASLERIRDVLALIFFAAVGSTIVSATIGSTALLVSGLMPVESFPQTWRAWWIGDAIGDLVVAPLIFVWFTWRHRSGGVARIAEAIALGAAVVAMSLLIFGASVSGAGFLQEREYMLFPPIIWAALRFGVRGSVTSAAVVMVIAVVRTSAGYGPFAENELHQNLLALQTFVGIASATFLVVGASISERSRSVAELVAARETAEAANRAKAGFLAAVSHELRTPLNAITGYVDMLELQLDGPLTEKQKSALSRISQSQRHLVRLIEDVLGFAQVEAGRLAFALQPVSVAEALASVEPIVGAEIAKKGLILRVDVSDPELMVKADPDKLRQILLNLVTNAIKFTTASGEIRIAAEPSEEQVHISVSDTGIGIPKDYLSRVFDPFFQVDQGATRKYPGLGLGLSIVRDVVLAMNGDVHIESTVGKGTTVSVLLPREADRPTPREERSA